MRSFKCIFLFVSCFFISNQILAQCTTLGQTPATAFPVCGTSNFIQNTVPQCQNIANLNVPNCGSGYPDKNPFYYKFTCYQSGTLGFIITPNDLADDYDWQLYDITGKDPSAIFTDATTIITGNWAGNPGTTGTTMNGVNFIQCGSGYNGTEPRYARVPDLIQGHEYLLMVSHFTETQSGYTLSFNGGTAVITDPKNPELNEAEPECDGKTIRIKMNKGMKCSSIAADGSDFSISPAITQVVSARSVQCSNSFDFDEVIITLADVVPNGNYDIIMKRGVDNNTLLDNCDREIPEGEIATFTRSVPVPIFADSVGSVGCEPNELLIYFPKRIVCSSIASDGSDFSINGPSVVSIESVTGNCVDGMSDTLRVLLSSPIVVGGNYSISLIPGNDGTVLIDECGLETPSHTLDFVAYDTVSAIFNISTILGCRENQVSFTHDGANNVNQWNWKFDSLVYSGSSFYNTTWSATSQHVVSLSVSNGICTDSVSETIIFDNEVIADFEMPAFMCPEDSLHVVNTSSGIIDSWHWSFGINQTSVDQQPAVVKYPETNIETEYPVLLTVRNINLNCFDTALKVITVLNNCYIAVPTGFTPNGDGLNDYLWPHNAIKAENLVFSVYNRWGQLVFQSKQWDRKWDGTLKGVPQAAGVYVWQLEFTDPITREKRYQKGTSTLIR